MSTKIFLEVIALLLVMQVILSCKKEYSCEGCINDNQPPVAIAGPDQGITLPTDSISLDGSSSNDPDGTISEWLWTKISGPASFNIVNTTTAKTVVRNLDTGIYRFELKVVDNGNLSATDTVQISITDPRQPNRPPVAYAGTDTTIILPANTVNLDGSASTDPDNNITGYAWTKISGPASFNFANGNAVQTQVTNLVEGVYQFELKVTDASGLFDTDTVKVQVTVMCPQPSPAPLCTTNCGKIVFVSNRDGNDEIYTCNADGSNVTRLTNDPVADGMPVWSPDGAHIVFCKFNVYPYCGNIYIMNADGSNVRQLTFTGDAAYPSWSPDGTKIAFTDMIDETVNGWVSTIKIVNSSNGSVLIQTGLYGASVIPSPAWSPDGTKIAFDSDWNGWDFVSDIFTICPNGGNRSLLTSQLFNDYDYWKPAWSPNGSKLSVTIFPMGYQGGTISAAHIGVMNPDGTGLTVIVTGNMGDYNVETRTSWSPDGERILFTSWDTNNTKNIKWVASNGSSSGTIITNGWDADWKH